MSNPEANFAVAAERAIAELQREVRKGRTAARIRNVWIVILSAVVVVIVLLGFELHSQAIASCQQGNDRAAGTVAAMDQLISVLEGPKPKPNIKLLATNLETYILQHNAPRNCQQAYHVWP